MDLVIFGWRFWSGGYQLIEDGGKLYISERGEGEYREYQPDLRTLLRRFADLSLLDEELDADEVRVMLPKFATDYGLLGFARSTESPRPAGLTQDRWCEPVSKWLSKSWDVRRVLELWTEMKKGMTPQELSDEGLRLLRVGSFEWRRDNLPREAQSQLSFAQAAAAFGDRELPTLDELLRKPHTPAELIPELLQLAAHTDLTLADDAPAFVKHTLAAHITAKLKEFEARATVTFDHDCDEMRFGIEPLSLLGAIWLQLGMSLKTGVQFRPCEVCDRFIEIGLHATGSRADKVICSDACRAKKSRLKERRKRATESHR